MRKNNNRIRMDYNNSAEFYNSRYEIIQYIKYTLLLPKLLSEKGTVRYKALLLDYGSGSGLILKYFIELMNYCNLRRSGGVKIYGENDEIKFLCFEIFLNDSVVRFSNGKSAFFFPSLILCDISHEMLVQSKQISENKSGEVIKDKIFGYVVCNGENLPFKEGVFGTAVSFTVLQNLSNKERGLSELKRVTKEESKIGISILKKKQSKLEYLQIIRKIFKGIKSISFSDDFRNKIKKTARIFYKNYDIFIQNSYIDDIMNVEDYFFFRS